MIADSIEHALAAGDKVHAAEIVEKNRNDELIADRWYVVEKWLAMLPEEVKHDRPILLLTDAWVGYCRLQFGRIASIVERVEALFDGQSLEPNISAELAFFRGSLEYWQGLANDSRQHLEESILQLAGKAPFAEAEAELALCLARCMAGDKEAAIKALEERTQRVDTPEGHFLTRLVAGLVFIHLLCGDISRARVEAQRLQIAARKSNIRNTAAWGSYFRACTHLHAHELDAASHHFARAVEQR